MLCLPSPADRGSRQPLAVSDASAAAIERSLLAGERHLGLNLLADAILADPWLALWLHRHAHAPTARDLADRAIDHLLEWLQPAGTADATSDPSDHWSRPEPGEVMVLTCAAARSLAAARAAQSELHDRHALVGSASFLAELLRVEEYLDSDPGKCAAGAQLYNQRDDGAAWRLPRLVQRLTAPPANSPEFVALLRQEKLEAMKELAYGASHEINNPLANISGRAQALLKEETDPSRRKLLQAINTQALRAHEMISDLMLFARPPKLVIEPTDLAAVIHQVAEELRTALEERSIEFDWTPPDEALVVEADPQQLCIAIKAVLQNAIDSVGGGGRIEVQAQLAASENNRPQVELRVRDTGPGLSDEVRHKAFDPFYSGREAGRGLGFGLSKAWRILTDHGGTIELENSNVHGTSFILCLPTKTTANQS